jgi:hypothetical protein
MMTKAAVKKLHVKSLKHFRGKGLLVNYRPDFPENHAAYPAGHIILKPHSAGGHVLPYPDQSFNDEEDPGSAIDAPRVVVCFKKGKWWCSVDEFLTDPGPGDFTASYKSEPEVVAAVCEYFWGPSSKMLDLINNNIEMHASRRRRKTRQPDIVDPCHTSLQPGL